MLGKSAISGCARGFARLSLALGPILGLALLAACGTSHSRSGKLASAPGMDAVGKPDDTLGISCVLYARAVSGIDIRGDAYTWWDTAAGRYLRGQVPEVGAVLVLAKTDRLQRGHLAVVRQVLDGRDILVDHSNWMPGRIITGMQVRDVSPDNDWTELRFLNPGYGVFGSIYLADGFIYQPVAVPTVGDASGQLRLQSAAQ